MRSDQPLGYSVLLTPLAQQDALEYAAFIQHDSPDRAARWLAGLEEAINELRVMPGRFRVIDERAQFTIELRQFLYYSHRVIYHIDEGSKTVHVLRIYHGRRDKLGPADLAGA